MVSLLVVPQGRFQARFKAEAFLRPAAHSGRGKGAARCQHRQHDPGPRVRFQRAETPREQRGQYELVVAETHSRILLGRGRIEAHVLGQGKSCLEMQDPGGLGVVPGLVEHRPVCPQGPVFETTSRGTTEHGG